MSPASALHMLGYFAVVGVVIYAISVVGRYVRDKLDVPKPTHRHRRS